MSRARRGAGESAHRDTVWQREAAMKMPWAPLVICLQFSKGPRPSRSRSFRIATNEDTCRHRQGPRQRVKRSPGRRRDASSSARGDASSTLKTCACAASRGRRGSGEKGPTEQWYPRNRRANRLCRIPKPLLLARAPVVSIALAALWPEGRIKPLAVPLKPTEILRIVTTKRRR